MSATKCVNEGVIPELSKSELRLFIALEGMVPQDGELVTNSQELMEASGITTKDTIRVASEKLSPFFAREAEKGKGTKYWRVKPR